MQVLSRPPSGWPALVLNADFRPLSYYPLSLWPWQDVIKAVFLDRVDVVSTYDQEVHSPSFAMRLPSVVSRASRVHSLARLVCRNASSDSIDTIVASRVEVVVGLSPAFIHPPWANAAPIRKPTNGVTPPPTITFAKRGGLPLKNGG